MSKKIFIISITILLITCNISIHSSANNFFEDENFDENNKKTDFWALIVASDPKDDSVGEWVFYETQLLKDVLLEYDWEEDHIKYLKGHVTRRDVYNGLSWLEEKSDSSDTVLVALFDHGMYGSLALYNPLPVRGCITYRDLDRKLDRISCAGMGVILFACQSGTAIPHLKQDGRVIITSCEINEHSGFSYLARGLEDFVDYKYDVGNFDGATSLEELYEYYMKVRHTYQNYDHHPRISDWYDGQLHLTFQNWSEGMVDQQSRYSAPPNSGKNLLQSNKHLIAQSFKPETDILTKIKVLVTPRIKIMPITLVIRKNLTGENITKVTIKPDHLSFTNDLKFITFDFPDIEIKSWETYYMILNTSSLNENESILRFEMDEIDSYEDGRCFESEDGGKTWQKTYASDLIFVTYGKDKNRNLYPYAPKRPSGPNFLKKNKDYKFYVTAKDIDGDDIFYQIDWGDGNESYWLGPYKSEEIVDFSYSWEKRGSYIIRVKAKDAENGYWGVSDGLKVHVSKSRLYLKFEELLNKFGIKEEDLLEFVGYIIGEIKNKLN